QTAQPAAQSTSPTQSRLAAEQFGRTANAYLSSAVHAQGADLERLAALAQGMNKPGLKQTCALDLGCGAGHAAFALSRGGAAVTAYDLSKEMLDVVAAEAARRGHAGLRTVQGPAERLPFGEAEFDLVATRFSAHHWSNVPAALNEARRVLKPGGTLAVIDGISPEMPILDTVLQTVEILRDASHVRDYRVSEWVAMVSAAGFAAPTDIDTWKLRMDFDNWVARMRTPELRVQAIRDVLAKAPEEAKRHFSIDTNSCFDLDVAWFSTRRASATGASCHSA
ncbi:MAG TPA: class I SAM-dependent methyltransferase, partial [Burkholderiales bacterium]|nr:class I SAM-dependent methyltransferase [Burkholderiales bacterium]